jgi:hypothetical protein
MKSKSALVGTLTRAVLIAAIIIPAAALFSGLPPAPKAAPHQGDHERHCVPVGGTV